MRFREPGLSMSAIQSSKQSSCATNAQGHGDLHCDDSAVSSVSSAKHIQHFLTSSSTCGRACDVEVGGCALGVIAGDGELSNTVCESLDTVDRALLEDR